MQRATPALEPHESRRLEPFGGAGARKTGSAWILLAFSVVDLASEEGGGRRVPGTVARTEVAGGQRGGRREGSGWQHGGGPDRGLA